MRTPLLSKNKSLIFTTFLTLTGIVAPGRGSDFASESRKLFADDGRSFDGFSDVMAVSGDFLAVGVKDADLAGIGSDAGAVYLFERHRDGSESWGLVRKITASDAGRADGFGSAVAIAGEVLTVGARGKGAVYVYRRHAGSEGWGETGILTANDGERTDRFGDSIACSGDFLAVSAPNADVDGKEDQGAVYLFDINDGGQEVGKLTASDGAAEDHFGLRVGLSGRLLAIGAPEADINGKTDQGAVYLFERSIANGQWMQSRKLQLDDGLENQEFGNVMAISGDTLAVGLPTAKVDTQNNRGLVYLFDRDQRSETWIPLAPLKIDLGRAGDQFGNAVALSGDTLAGGAHFADVDGKSDQGVVYLYRRDRNEPNTWVQKDVCTVSGAIARDRVGSALKMSGSTLVVGSTFAKINGNSKQGAAIVFEMSLYDRWLREQFGDATVDNAALRDRTWGKNADPDHDSLTNFEEAYFGTDPRTPNTADPSFQHLGDRFRNRWQGDRDFLGIVATPQWSRDLKQWFPTDFSVRDTSAYSDSGRDSFEAILPTKGAPRLFVRLHLQLQSQ